MYILLEIGALFVPGSPLLFSCAQGVTSLPALPLRPRRRLSVQCHPSQDPVSSSILNVEMDIIAFHRNNNIEVDLQVVRDALFHRECMRRDSDPPSLDFCDTEEYGAQNEHDGPDTAG